MSDATHSRYRAWVFVALSWICSAPVVASSDFSVVVSIKPVHSIVSGLMKDAAEPVLLINGERTPYTFQPDSTDRQLLAEASLVIWVGAELEQSLQAELEALPAEKVIELLSSERLKILPSRNNPDRRDPFFWMDDRNMLILLEELTEILIQADPSRAHIYSRNRRQMLKPLQRIDKEYEYGYRGLKAGLGVLYHDTLRYFEQAYALKTLGQVTGSPRDRVEAVKLLGIRNIINDGQASCLFIDRSMPTSNLDLLVRNTAINIGELDVFGSGFEAGPNLYLQLMNYNTDVIKQCLNADMASAAQARAAASLDLERAIDGLGGKFILTDHHGDTFTEQDLKGQFSLLYFGYTHCPDICPTGLSILASALEKLPSRARQVKPVFITLDPLRDTVSVMQQYVRYFDSRLIGLTGSASMTRRIADQFRVRYEKVPSDIANPQEYAVDHSAGFYLLAPDGSFITKFAQSISADDLAGELARIVR